MSVLLQRSDWTDSPLRAPHTWPSELRTIVRTMLDSKFPMFVAWGDELGFLYNDAYAEFLGNKHPAAFGTRFHDVWTEIWDDIFPIIKEALSGEAVYIEDMPLTILRNGRDEARWFTFCYSPARDTDSRIQGVFCVVKDSTTRVLALRRQRFQLRLADVLRPLQDPHAMMSAASRLLGEFLGVGRVGYGEVDGGNVAFSVSEEWNAEKMGALTGITVPLERFGEAVVNEVRQGRTLHIEDACTDPRCMSDANAYADIGLRSALVVPLLEKQQFVAFLYVHDDIPRRWSEEDARLAEEVAHRTWDALKRARAEEALQDETRILDILNKTAATAASTLDVRALLQSITDAATEVSGAKYGAFFYNSMQMPEDSKEALVLFTLSGAPRKAFERFGHPRATPVFGPTLNGGAPVRSDDITQDERYGKMPPHFGMPEGHLPVRSYLAVSVVSRSGETIGGLFLGHPDPGVFTERTERLIVGIATQAAMALDNARLYEAAKLAAQERQQRLVQERLALAESERMNKMKDEFLAMLAHELRNPLAPISTAADVLHLLYESDPKVQETAGTIRRQVDHMTTLVDDLLDVSRVTRGLVTLQKTPVDLKEVISAAVEQVQPLFTAKQQQLSMQLPVAPMRVHGDFARLVQVAANLLNNAAKYTQDEGHIVLDVSVIDEQACIIVRDDGVGMASELVQQVFELFSQGARTLARSQGGLGLGLALVKKLVELHGGSVSAYSEGAGKGSAFTMMLPLYSSQELQTTENNDSSPYPAPRSTSTTAPMHILVVDDNVDAATMLASYLRHMGQHVVTVAYSAHEALECAASIVPAALLLDIGLPGMDGYELARRLREMPHLQSAVFVAVTGYGSKEDRKRSQDAGFDHHFVKPVNHAHIGKVLEQLVAGAGARNTRWR